MCANSPQIRERPDRHQFTYTTGKLPDKGNIDNKSEQYCVYGINNIIYTPPEKNTRVLEYNNIDDSLVEHKNINIITDNNIIGVSLENNQVKQGESK